MEGDISLYSYTKVAFAGCLIILAFVVFRRFWGGGLGEVSRAKRRRKKRILQQYRRYTRTVRPLLNDLGKETWGRFVFVLFPRWRVIGNAFVKYPDSLCFWAVHYVNFLGWGMAVDFLVGYPKQECYMVILGLDEQQEPVSFAVVARDYVAVCSPTGKDLEKKIREALEHGPIRGYMDPMPFDQLQILAREAGNSRFARILAELLRTQMVAGKALRVALVTAVAVFMGLVSGMGLVIHAGRILLGRYHPLVVNPLVWLGYLVIWIYLWIRWFGIRAQAG